jgi:hypothetical protein
MDAGWTNLIETVKSTPVWRPPWRTLPAWVLSALLWIALILLMITVFGD